MKYTIEGFSQEYAMTMKKQVTVRNKIVTKQIDCTDLVILRWFVDFYPNMKKIEVDGKQYAWLTHSKLLKDLPIIDISKRSFIDRMQKLVEFEILDYKLLKEGGTFSLYGFGKNYINLVQSDRMQSNNTGDDGQTAQGEQSNKPQGSGSNNTGVVQSTDTGEVVQPANKDSSINDSSFNDSSIKNKSIIYKEIVDFLNEKAGTAYRPTTKKTQTLIDARMHEGFTVEQIKIVIQKKCDDWLGNAKMEEFLRPLTLFGDKFESYLNAPVSEKKKFGATGVEIKKPTEQDDDLKGIL